MSRSMKFTHLLLSVLLHVLHILAKKKSMLEICWSKFIKWNEIQIVKTLHLKKMKISKPIEYDCESESYHIVLTCSLFSSSYRFAACIDLLKKSQTTHTFTMQFFVTAQHIWDSCLIPESRPGLHSQPAEKGKILYRFLGLLWVSWKLLWSE